MFKRNLLSVFFSLLFIFGNSQDTFVLYTSIEYPSVPDVYSTLVAKMEESSGLIYFDGSPWTFNDSGGKPELYRVDPENGEISQCLTINNATNIDWEDITQDENYIYIGDFGNNAGNRKNLTIYKIPKNKIGKSKNENVTAEAIGFSYADQKSFEENWRNHNFDCESVVSYNDSLVLFTKNWEDRKTRLYVLPKNAGNYLLSPECSFAVDGLVTGADYHPVGQRLVLVGYENKKPFVFVFRNFNGKKLGGNDVFRINLPRWVKSQTEGICFIDENTVLISTEQTKTFEQAIFRLNIREVFRGSGIEFE